MEGFKKNIYLLTEEETKSVLTLSEIAQLRKGQRFQSGVTFSQDMTDYDVRNLLESLFPDILPNKRFSCATRDGQSSSQFNFHGEHRVWDGRTIKRKVKGQSAMYLVLKDVVEDKLVFNPVLPARGTPSSLQGHSLSTSFCHNSKNSQTVSLTQTPQSATTVTSMNTTNSTENAAERWTELEQNMLTNNPDVLDDILSSLDPSDTGFENLLSPTGFGAVETTSEASSLTNGSQEHNQPQNQIPSTDTFQSNDSAFSSSEETVSQNGIFSVHGTTQQGRVTKPIRAMGIDCLPSDKRDSSGQSDSGISSEANGQAPNPPISLRIQKATMEPTEGPLQGGGLFQAEIEEELPPSVKTGWAIFGKKSVKVRVSRDGLALSGKGIPCGDAPGPVTVTFITLNGECVAKGTYTYRETENPTTRQSIRTKRAFDEFDESLKRLKREFGLCDESDECTAEGNHETGGDTPGPVTVTFTTLNGECVAKETHTYRESENLTTWQSTRTKRAFDDFDESVKRLKREFGSCDESDECAAEGNHETGGDALGPVTVTFTTLNGECVAKETHTYRENENPTTWQSTRTKRAFDEFEESVKHFESDFGSCDGSDQFAAEKYHETAVTQVVKDQLLEESYFGDAETSDPENEEGPSDRRMIMLEIQGTFRLEDGTEIIIGFDSTERETFFMWKSPDREFKTSVKELKSYFDATRQIFAQTPEVIGQTQTPEVMEEDIAKLIEDKDRKEISTQTPDTLEEIIETSAERWRKVQISTETNETEEVFRKSDETKGEDSPAEEQIGVQAPEDMEEIIVRSSEDKGQRENSTQKPDTAEEFTGTPAEKWMEDSPIKVQIRTQNPVVGEEYRPSDETNVEDSCEKVLVSPPPSEGKVKIIETSAEFQREGSYHKEPIATQMSEVEKEIIGTPVEDKGLEDSLMAIQICTQTFEVVGETIRTPAEDQLLEEGYFGDAETSDTESEEGCSFLSLDPLYSLTESDIHDRQLPEGIGARWKDLARKLGFKERSIEVIEKENCTCHDRCIKLLVRWMEKGGQHGATVGKLAEALKAIELQSLADRLIGPSDRRMIMLEIQGTFRLEDGTEIIIGFDSTERETFFMWKSPDREFKTSVKETENPKQSSFFIIEGSCNTTRVKETNAEFGVPGSG